MLRAARRAVEVVAEAIREEVEESGVKATAGRLGVSESTLHLWRAAGGWLHVAPAESRGRETFPLELIELDEPVATAFDRWLHDVSVPDLRALSDEEPEDDMVAVQRADHGPSPAA